MNTAHLSLCSSDATNLSKYPTVNVFPADSRAHKKTNVFFFRGTSVFGISRILGVGGNSVVM
jgi:hypothetical protein